ncbi:IgA Peptidase M64 [Pirellulimonas nuda]|uniref:IgA Peptidase M64 n=1 Tax=Pirellulimonas nuda TaxID=2528009 RepID=A0A518D8J8_9BACT|nr:M64 family metallopeptidase [Pirellulimonas nuda]QDU87795.1 IgA Peptidase M64 [Pirellulimonas nuda]
MAEARSFFARRGVVAAMLLAALLLAAACPPAGAAPTTIVNNGPSSNRVDIVFLGDGYTAANHLAGTYDAHINGFVDYMFDSEYSDPFPRYANFFNIHKIVTNSAQSGADIPNATPPVSRQTFFHASYETALGDPYDPDDPNDRLLVLDEGLAHLVRTSELGGTGITADMKLMSVNSNKYGGSGGVTAAFAGANAFSYELGMHEMAHSWVDLADEYGGDATPYAGAEPTEVNVTTDPAGAKWAHWAGFDDPRRFTLDITTQQGGRYFDSGIYRPSFDSKMRTVHNEPPRHYDAVSREQFILKIYEFVNPLDAFKPGSSVTDEPLWVDVIDPEVIKVEWFVDHTLVPGATGETFHPADYGFGPGTYEVTANAYDEAMEHAFQGGMLDLVRTNLSTLHQYVEWTLTVSDPADFDESGVVDQDDYELWVNKFGGPSPPWWGNRDGLVEAADYTVWRDAFSGRRALGAAGVPEPGALGLAALAIVALAAGRRRR